MKRKKSFWISLAKYLALGFILGYLFSFIMYQGYWYLVLNGLKIIPWYGWILGLIVVFFFTLLIHELGHLLAFIVQGVKIRALYLFIFVFYRNQNGLKFKIQPKLWYLIGGFVVPDLPIIDDETTYQNLVIKFGKALIAAPIVTIVFMVVIDLTFILSVYFQASSSFLGWLFLAALFTTLISWVYIKTFSLSNKSFYGDFVAYKKIKQEPVFQIIQLIQYQQFSLSDDLSSHPFLYHKMISILENTELNTSLFHQILLMQYIEYVVYEKMPSVDSVTQKLERYPKNHLYKTLEGLSLLYDLAAYYYTLHDVEKAYQIIDLNAKKASQKIDEKQRHYLDLKFRHILHLSYHDEALDQEHIALGKEELFEAILDLKKLQKESHQPLPFQEWSCAVSLETSEEENKNTIEG